MDHAVEAVGEFLNLAKDLPAGTFIFVPVQIAGAVIDGYKVHISVFPIICSNPMHCVRVQLANRNKRGATLLVKHTCDLMVPLVRTAASHSKEELGDALTDELNSLPKLLTEVQEGMLQITGRGAFAIFLKRRRDRRLIEDLTTKLRQRLQTFEVKGLLDTHIRLNVNERARREDHAQTQAALEKNWAGMHARFDQFLVTKTAAIRACPYPLLPAVSPHLIGRDGLIAHAVATIADSSHPHISFFGTGGVGKTSMALAVAHDERSVQRFCDYRYFVECEALTSASAVRSSILQVLAGSSNAPSQGDPRQLLAGMLSVDHLVLLILDNFETPWNTSGQRSELTGLLKDIAAMPNVCIITTLRSDDAPASGDVAWTRIPVQVLTLDDARDVFLSINPSTNRADHDDLDRLLSAIDCLPLAVKLLAEVKKHQRCSELLQRWQDTKTSLVKTERQGGTRLTSLDVSISLSLHSPLVDDVARALLATICQLPAGVIGGRAKLKAMDLGVRDVDEKLDALLEVALLTDDRATGRLTMPPPIRAYIFSQTFHTYEEQLETHYISQIEHWHELSMGDGGYVESQDGLLAEVDNIRHFFQYRMAHHPSLKLGRAVFEFAHLECLARPSTELITGLVNQLTRIGWEEHRPHCVMRLGVMYSRLSNITEAERELQTALEQFVEAEDRLGAAQCLVRLGDAHRLLNMLAKAEHELQAAQTQFVEIGDKFGVAQCLRNLGNVHRMLNKCTQAEYEFQAAQAQFAEIGDKRGVAQCLHRLGDVHMMLGKHTEAEHELQAAHAQLVEVGHRTFTAWCLRSLGDAHKMLSKYTEAEDELQAARAQFVEIGDIRGAPYCLQSLGEVHMMLNQYTEAEQELQAAQAQLLEVGDTRGAAWCLRSLGDLHRMVHKLPEAEHELKTALAQFIDTEERFGALQCLWILAEMFRGQQRWPEAEALLAEAESIASPIGDFHGQAWTCRHRGRLYKAQGRYEEAGAQCTLSRDYFLSIGLTKHAEDVMRE